MDKHLVPDTTHIQKFLENWGGPWNLATLNPETKYGPKVKPFVDAVEAATWAAERNEARLNVYFHINPTSTPMQKKAKKEHIKEVRWFYVDIDPADNANLSEDRARIESLLTNNLPDGVPKPTIVVDSGAGYWGYWRLNEPFEINGDKSKAAEPEAFMEQLEKVFKADKCRSIDHLARLPGTVNWPDQKKRDKGRKPALSRVVEEAENWSASYSTDDFKLKTESGDAIGELLAPFVSQTDQHKIHPDFDAKLEGRELSPQQLELLEKLASLSDGDLFKDPKDEQIPSELANLQATHCVRNKDDLAKTDNGELCRIDPAERGYSESEPLVAFAGECLSHNVLLEIIMSFLLSPDWAIGKHALNEKNSMRAARRAVATAIITGPSETKIVGADGAVPFSHEHLALVFADKNKDSLRYVTEWDQWLAWNDRYWAQDRTKDWKDKIRKLCRAAAAKAKKVGQKKSLCTASTSEAISKLVKVDQRLAIVPDLLDADPWKLNTPSGLLDLKTGIVAPNTPKALCTKITKVPVADEGMKPDAWLAFLHQITFENAEYVAYLQRMCGYFLTGETSQHALFFAWGTGGNGKSVFVNTLRYIMGSYATSTPMDTLMVSNSPQHTTELADLRGARLVTAQETEEGRRLAIAKVKQMTGGDPIKARFMRQDFFEFTPEFKLFMVGNQKPKLPTVDAAMERRLHLLPFTYSVPKEKVDRQLEQKLQTEAAAILRWMVDGTKIYQSEGLNRPELVQQATQEYLEDEDIIGRWIEDCCVRGKLETDPTGGLHSSYQTWCNHNGYKPKAINTFSSALVDRGFTREQTGGIRRIVGLRLTQEGDILTDGDIGSMQINPDTDPPDEVPF